MKIIFDVDRLRELLSAFCKITGITVTLFDAELKPIADAGEWKEYCLSIGSREELLSKCDECNHLNADVSRKKGDTVIYTCHAGIAEAVTPIFHDGLLIAFLMIGKFRDAEGVYSSEEKVASAAGEYGLDAEKMRNAYLSLPLLGKDSIDAVITILKALVRYIVDEKYIRLERNRIASDIEKYIDEHLSEKITVDTLCRNFYAERHVIYEIFKSNFSDKPQNYIHKKQLKKAMDLLENTNMSVREVAESVGFSEYNYFIQFFKKKTGVSPLQYRKRT